MSKYDQLRNRALANFESLLNHWNINFTKINEDEYDFINPTRNDNNFGACRFNLSKGVGADFSGADFTMADYERIGPGFTKEDFAGLLRGDKNGWGFDVVGLCQRLHNINNYSDAAKLLGKHLRDIKQKGGQIIAATKADQLAREHKRDTQKHKALIAATKTWNMCENFKDTLGEKYLISRKIYLKEEPNIKFHAKIYNKELGFPIPALLFQVQISPTSPLVAIHRIYLAKDGSRKAKVESPKMALGSIKGAGIWFGEPNKQLCILEGMENALTVRVLGYPFVVSTVNATNYSNIIIPDYVSEILLMPDPDKAGYENSKKAIKEYSQQVNKISIVYPPKRKLENDKLADWNDVLCEKGEPIG